MLGLRNFVVQVRLRDGATVTFQQVLPEEVIAWPARLLLILLVLLVSVAVLAALAVRALTRPLAVLADAAGELGRDIRRPPLAEAGPLEVRRAARAFNTMQERLIRYIEDRNRILAALSHDLKTPITRLRLRTELLDDAPLRDKFLADLDDMQRMAQASLDFLRGGEDSEPIAPVDLNALLESLQEDAEDAGHEVRIAGTSPPAAALPAAGAEALSDQSGGQRPELRPARRDRGYGYPDTADADRPRPWPRHSGGGIGAGVRAVLPAGEFAQPRYRRHGLGIEHRPQHRPRPRRGIDVAQSIRKAGWRRCWNCRADGVPILRK
ncbi:MAG: HAMP domain-containing protein [Desulfomicrobium escambiense]|nr:HAMP domain-containing protein [Desulfomicrobium escambiense]